MCGPLCMTVEWKLYVWPAMHDRSPHRVQSLYVGLFVRIGGLLRLLKYIVGVKECKAGCKSLVRVHRHGRTGQSHTA